MGYDVKTVMIAMNDMMETSLSIRTQPARSLRAVALHAAALVVMTAALLGATGCGTVQPYERGKLAHPTMTAGDMAGFGESHLRAISEGATGGSGGTGSGCGCN